MVFGTGRLRVEMQNQPDGAVLQVYKEDFPVTTLLPVNLMYNSLPPSVKVHINR